MAGPIETVREKIRDRAATGKSPAASVRRPAPPAIDRVVAIDLGRKTAAPSVAAALTMSTAEHSSARRRTAVMRASVIVAADARISAAAAVAVGRMPEVVAAVVCMPVAAEGDVLAAAVDAAADVVVAVVADPSRCPFTR